MVVIEPASNHYPKLGGFAAMAINHLIALNLCRNCGRQFTVPKRYLIPIAKSCSTRCRLTALHHSNIGKDYSVDPGYVVNANGCWIFNGHKTSKGYAGFIGNTRAGRRHAHIAYYERANGPVPEGLELDHLCRVTTCVNPEHLEAVTHAENCRRSSWTKLNTAKAAEIRRRRLSGETTTSLASEFGVSRTTISDIWRGRTWVAI